MTAAIFHLPRARSEDGLLAEMTAIVRASQSGAVPLPQAERDAQAVLRCWSTIQRREGTNAGR